MFDDRVYTILKKMNDNKKYKIWKMGSCGLFQKDALCRRLVFLMELWSVDN